MVPSPLSIFKLFDNYMPEQLGEGASAPRRKVGGLSPSSGTKIWGSYGSASTGCVRSTPDHCWVPGRETAPHYIGVELTRSGKS